MKLLCAFFVIALLCDAKVPLTGIAAGTTIGVNLLTIKERIQQGRKAAHATKQAIVKAARKLSGK